MFFFKESLSITNVVIFLSYVDNGLRRGGQLRVAHLALWLKSRALARQSLPHMLQARAVGGDGARFTDLFSVVRLLSQLCGSVYSPLLTPS